MAESAGNQGNQKPKSYKAQIALNSLKGLVCTLLLGVTATTQAQVPGSTRLQTEQASPLVQRIAPDNVQYFSAVFGPGFEGRGDRLDQDGQIDGTGPNTWNQLSFQWKLNDRINFIANPRFTVYHRPETDQDPIFDWEDPVFGLLGTWIKTDRWTFAGGLNTMVPFLRGNGAKDAGRIFNPGGFNSLSYQINPGLSVGSWVFARANFYNESTTDQDRVDLELYPNIAYAWNDRITTQFFYWIVGDVENDYHIAANHDDSLNLLVRFKISRALVLEPQIQVFRHTDYALADGNFNLWVSGNLF